MRRKRSGTVPSAAFLIATMLGSVLALHAAPVFALPGCGVTITANTTLSTDIGPCSGNGVTIGANGVVLDCAGHTISGAASGYGIYLSGITGAVIKNCDVTGFQDGYEVDSSSNNTLTGDASNNASFSGFDLYLASNGNTFTGDSAIGQVYGFTLEYSDGNTFDGDTAKSTGGVLGGGQGFELSYGSMNYLGGDIADNYSNYGFVVGSTQNTLVNNTADSDGGGFTLAFNASQNVLIGNTANDDGNGYFLNGAPDNTLTNGTADGDPGGGFLVVSSPGTILIGNAASSDGYGFWLYSSAGSNLTQNTADNSTAESPYVADGSGFYISNSSGSDLSGNTAYANGAYGFYVDSSTSGSVLSSNLAVGNTNYGYVDDSSGTGTGGTANKYQSDECNGNHAGSSSPAGLCTTFTTLATIPLDCGGSPIVVSQGYVYWLNVCGDEIQRVPESGGSVQNVTALPGSSPGSTLFIGGMTAWGPWIFWTQSTIDLVSHTMGNGSLMRAPLWGGPAQLVLALGGNVFSAPTANGNYIYFSVGGTIMRITPYGTGLQGILDDPALSIWQVAVSQGDVYSYNPSDGSIYSSTYLGVGLTRLSGPSSHSGGGGTTPGVRDIIVAGGSVFWSDDRNGTNTVDSVSINGGATHVLVSGGPNTFYTTVAEAGQSVAFIATGTNAAYDGLFLVPDTGGTVTPLVPGTTVQDMAVSGSLVFFSAVNSTENTIDVAQLPSG